MSYAVGTLVRARGREWVVLPESRDDLLIVRPLGGTADDTAGLLVGLEHIEHATFPPPSADDLGDHLSASMLRQALRIGLRSSAGPFRSLAGLAVEPRSYQLVPLLLALRHDTVRLLISDDVGIGKTVEAGLIAAELLAQGDADGLAVICSPALAEQWQTELRTKFNLDAETVLASTATRLERGLSLGQSLFDKHRITVVSADFIKTPRRRDEFIRTCPNLVIVDEAHTCVADGAGRGGTGRTQRYELLQRLAADPTRHLILVTATPHSGKPEGFDNLVALLDPSLRGLDLDRLADRELLAQHFVQRRRADIRTYIDEETPFPEDRLSRDETYRLTPEYDRLFRKVLAYARETVRDDTGTLRQRVRWWSALALLRALASSPRAAAATLRTRARAAAADDPAEADRLGRASVLDTGDDESLESADAIPGSDPGDDDTGGERARLLAMAREAEALEGKPDAKLSRAIEIIRELLADGCDPIVFCRFIQTAEYVGEQLAPRLPAGTVVRTVTGQLPPDERIKRIEELGATEGRHVLVATDCLSEGVNLQEHFQAVVHYDLAWNPTRHEQREGRVDRFGQRARVVRTVVLYGEDNRIDSIVLEVLLRKHREIRRALGVSIPVPEQSDSLVQALAEGVLFADNPDQLMFEGIGVEQRRALHGEWDSAAARERTSHTKYAQVAIKPEDVAVELAEIRRALGSRLDVATFVAAALTELRAEITEDPKTHILLANLAGLPIPAREALESALPARHPDPLPFEPDLPGVRGHAVLNRTDPAVEALARYVLDTALDPNLAPAIRPARRAGVIRTRAVTSRTTVLLLRFRYHLTLPAAGTGADRELVAEDAAVLAFTGAPEQPTWLPVNDVEALLTAQPDVNVPADQAHTFATQATDALPLLTPHLEAEAANRAEVLRASHAQARSAAAVRRRGLRVTPQLPVDILGIYVLLPAGSA